MRYIPLSLSPLPPGVEIWAYYEIEGETIRLFRADFLCLGEVIDEKAEPSQRRRRSLYPVVFQKEWGEWMHPEELGDNFLGFDGPVWTEDDRPQAAADSQDASAPAEKT